MHIICLVLVLTWDMTLCLHQFPTYGVQSVTCSKESTTLGYKDSVIVDKVHKPRVLWHDGIACGHGLFPAGKPQALFYCPSQYYKTSWAVRQLTMLELLRVYQVPLQYDDHVLRQFNLSRVLPFELAPPTDLLTGLLRQLWGSSGGAY